MKEQYTNRQGRCRRRCQVQHMGSTCSRTYCWTLCLRCLSTKRSGMMKSKDYSLKVIYHDIMKQQSPKTTWIRLHERTRLSSSPLTTYYIPGTVVDRLQDTQTTRQLFIAACVCSLCKKACGCVDTDVWSIEGCTRRNYRYPGVWLVFVLCIYGYCCLIDRRTYSYELPVWELQQ